MLANYRNAPIPQNDGSAYWKLNCVAAGTADLMDRATLGAFRYTGADVRFESGDRSGGLDYYTAAKTGNAMTNGRAGLKVVLSATRGMLRDAVTGGQSAVVSIEASVTYVTSRRTNGLSSGGHAVYAVEWRWTDRCACEKKLQGVAHGEFLVDDPGTTYTGYLYWSADLLFRAAEKRSGGQGINFMHGADTEWTKVRAIASGKIRTGPVYTAPAVADILVATTYTVSTTTNGGGWKRHHTAGYGNGWWYVVNVNGTTKDGWMPGQTARAA